MGGAGVVVVVGGGGWKGSGRGGEECDVRARMRAGYEPAGAMGGGRGARGLRGGEGDVGEEKGGVCVWGAGSGGGGGGEWRRGVISACDTQFCTLTCAYDTVGRN